MNAAPLPLSVFSALSLSSRSLRNPVPACLFFSEKVEEDNKAALEFYNRLGFKTLFVDRAARRYDTSGFLLQNVRTSKLTMRKVCVCTYVRSVRSVNPLKPRGDPEAPRRATRGKTEPYFLTPRVRVWHVCDAHTHVADGCAVCCAPQRAW